MISFKKFPLAFASLFLYNFGQQASPQNDLTKILNNPLYFDKYQFEEYAQKYIRGARSAYINRILADEVVNNSSVEISKIIARIKKNIFRDIEKNIVLFGPPGTGKSTIAKAIAYKSDVACLIFDAGKISNSFMNSGVETLRQIFDSALQYVKPCIIVFDELEALTKKHHAMHNSEGDILISLWQEIDRVSDSNIIVILNMNSKKQLPAQMTGRVTEVLIDLPDLTARQFAFLYNLNEQKRLWNVHYYDDVWDIAFKLAMATPNFSQRDIKSVVIKATSDSLIDDDNKLVTLKDFMKVIELIKTDPARIEELQKDSLHYEIKKYCKLNAFPLINTALSIAGLIAGYLYHVENINFSRSYRQSQSIPT